MLLCLISCFAALLLSNVVKQALKEVTITTDNVTITIRTPFLPNPTFAVAAPGNGNQGATSEGLNPNGYLALIAVPFGTAPPAESDRNNPLPAAQSGGADAYRAKLREYRIASGGNPQPGPTASLFGKQVASDVNLMETELHTATNVPTLYVEWVVEAGPRLWIVRIARQLPDGTKNLDGEQAFLQSLQSLSISSNTLNNPSTLPPAIGSDTIPQMPKTGVAFAWDYRLPALLTALFAGLLLLGGIVLRRNKRKG
jgi:hypothetical protein